MSKHKSTVNLESTYTFWFVGERNLNQALSKEFFQVLTDSSGKIGCTH